MVVSVLIPRVWGSNPNVTVDSAPRKNTVKLLDSPFYNPPLVNNRVSTAARINHFEPPVCRRLGEQGGGIFVHGQIKDTGRLGAEG